VESVLALVVEAQPQQLNVPPPPRAVLRVAQDRENQGLGQRFAHRVLVRWATAPDPPNHMTVSSLVSTGTTHR